MTQTDVLAPLVFNLYPAVVTPPKTERLQQTRAAATRDRMIVYIGDKATGEIHVVVDIVIAEIMPDGTRAWTVTDADGQIWRVAPDGDCGCSSPLKVMPQPLPTLV